MHDEMLERRLGDALHSEGDSLGLTITSAELERRLAARRRARSTRGFGLLLAAALSIGALGAAAVAGGFFNNHLPGPGPSQLAQVPRSEAPAPSAPIASSNPVGPAVAPELPSLSELIGRVGVTGLIVAQEHGPAVAGGIETAGATRSLLDLGPTDGHGSYEVLFACVTDGTADDLAGIATVLAGSAVGAPNGTIPCDGTVTTEQLGELTGPFLVRVSTPRQSSWRIVVRLTDGPDFPPSSGLSKPVAGSGQTTVVDASGDHHKPWPTIGDTTTALGSLPRRPVYHAQASCLGARSIAWRIGIQDSPSSVFADTTTVVPCDGRIHSADLSFGEMNWEDVFVLANPGADWHLLVTVEPPPIAIAPDVPGWKHFTDAGPQYMFDDIGWTLADNRSDGSSRIRVVITCVGDGSVDVSITPNDTSGDPPIQSYAVPCSSSQPTTDARIIELPQGSWNVDTQVHGRMWYAATVQKEVASAAP